jgi:sporulation protein YlmC with PRC-barrel domain
MGLLSFASVTAAQKAEQDPPAPPAAREAFADIKEPKRGPWSAEKLMDTSIRSAQGEVLGEVEDLLVDDNGKIVSVVVETSSFLGMGGKYVLLPIENLELTRDRDGKVFLKSNDKAKFESASEYEDKD